MRKLKKSIVKLTAVQLYAGEGHNNQCKNGWCTSPNNSDTGCYNGYC